MLWLIVLVLLLVVFYKKAIKPLSYWKDRGVPHKKALPLIGNSSVLIFKHKSFLEYVEDIYNEFPNDRYYGLHQFTRPLLCIRDLDLIKRITVKDFDQFVDHNNFVVDNVDSLMSKNLINLKGQTWRDMRATLSPSFTSRKMRAMFLLFSECSQQVVEFFERKDEGVIQVEMKDLFTRFTNDAIASTAFGFKCDSLTNQTNEFYTMGKKATTFGGSRLLAMSFLGMFPFLQRIIKFDIFPNSVSKFFRRVIKEAIDKRENEGLVRHDMLHLLLEARKGVSVQEEPELEDTGFATVQESKIHHGKSTNLKLTDEDITAQALIFFFGGFETSATLLSFMAYELALNPDIQERLQAEIDDTLHECNGKLTYNALQYMKYMDMVVSETLRQWPPGFQLDRRCVRDYVIEPEKPHEKPVTIEKGMMIIIPAVGIHRDPQHFENPTKFDPERFNDENKVKIKPYSYLPFGSGPRNCIASRFALLETKTLMFHILAKFSMVVIDKTQIPLKLDKARLSLVAQDGIWLGLQPRKK
ncbi:cytochrome P450 9e2-like [Photinus pyralis]|uniref:cytochrome P450 9e2-like n=1 Tax=Photinus pyralis TaxID=7054 RepID=UPI001266FCFE|nr:cytochrome P450 9e2-like [Photinus pyralis]XP_031353177.1 cytochrome P450 9e2-like [Photinus pyralis]XP_031353178.1 cytochrome P450 9e2-like [Photinus pyralis]